MATPYIIRVPANDTGLLKWEQTDETAAKVSELLQKDLETNHVFYNKRGFHDHATTDSKGIQIVHHLLALYGTGASPEALETAYAANDSYQVKAKEPHAGVVEELKRGWTKDSPYLGKGDHYPDFLKFFQDEIDDRGWQEVLQEYVFKGDERSDGLFGRLFAGLLHPLIQLMYGIEWQQPAIIASALAQAAVHENRAGPFLAKVEQAAARSRPAASSSRLTVPELFESIRHSGGNEKLAASARWGDDDKIHGGVLGRAQDEALELLVRVRVGEGELEEKLAEMLHTSAYVAAAAAFHPPNVPKLDFFLMHHLTSAPFFITLLNFPWLAPSTKARMLEWKLRFHIIQYIACGCPPLRLQALESISATPHNVSRSEDLLPRFHSVIDDGHTIKAVRALLIAQRLSRQHADKPWIRIPDDETWLQVHRLLLGATEGQQDHLWVRWAGFDEAWDEIPEAK